jgi:SPP1 family predicted phage head-tail adaptor
MMSPTHAFTAGEFRFMVGVERPIETPDGAGGSSTAWVAVIPVVWCHVEQNTANENYNDQAGGRVRTFQSVRFTTWWREDIKATDRLVFDGVLYNIRAVNNLLNRNKFLQITAESGVEQ